MHQSPRLPLGSGYRLHRMLALTDHFRQIHIPRNAGRRSLFDSSAYNFRVEHVTAPKLPFVHERLGIDGHAPKPAAWEVQCTAIASLSRPHLCVA